MANKAADQGARNRIPRSHEHVRKWRKSRISPSRAHSRCTGSDSASRRCSLRKRWNSVSRLHRRFRGHTRFVYAPPARLRRAFIDRQTRSRFHYFVLPFVFLFHLLFHFPSIIFFCNVMFFSFYYFHPKEYDITLSESLLICGLRMILLRPKENILIPKKSTLVAISCKLIF